MHNIVRRVIAAALDLAAASRFLWVVKAAESTVYLFGTIHLLPPPFEWRSRETTRAAGMLRS
jgi:uncharacterized protein YbaP (TraB family)